MSNHKYLFKIYYIGKPKYFGSQRQPDFMSIEQCLLNALLKRGYINDIEKSKFEFASRTDRYVSARGACFTCVIEKKPILMEINSALPNEIGVWAHSEVPLQFTSRYNAILRHYIYVVPFPISFYRKLTGINIHLIRKACRELEGRHDFANFSKKEDYNINTTRNMDLVEVSIYDDYIFFQFKSKAFLRQQIRRIVKKLLELGTGEITYEDFLKLLNTSHKISYQPADPRGLILWNIQFNKEIEFITDTKSKKRMNEFFIKNIIDYNFKNHLFRILQHDDFS
ncbi:MAG: tRNA pseudouridine synthase A [Candidatus Odinarchaeota archaeon]